MIEKLDEFIDWYRTKLKEFGENCTDALYKELIEEDLFDRLCFELVHIRYLLTGESLDKRVEGFIKLKKRYIEQAEREGNCELLFDNLISVPDDMLNEFEEFGFIK